MKDLFKRSISGLIYVALILGSTIGHPYAFAVVFAILLYLTLSEFYNLAGLKNTLFHKTVSVLCFLLVFAAVNNMIPDIFTYLSFLLIPGVWVREMFRKTNNQLKNSSIAMTGIIYVVIPFCMLNFMIMPTIDGVSGFYPWILVGIFFIIWIYDSMAYVTGSLWGKHKIAKAISPGKSWEGFVGGTVFAIITGILNAVMFPALTMTGWIIVSILAVISGTLGDFFESALKRGANQKDSGDLIPGHGGMLDRLDSLLFAIPVIFVWLKLSGTI